MGCGHNRFHRFAISFLILLISTSSHFRLFSLAEGRKLAQTAQDNSKEEKALIWRSQIGSRPPRCERRCSSCTHCEAIQVPTNPQTTKIRNNNSSTTQVSNIAYARSDDNSNYKPMSWKCKCGNLIFNP
ncbi:hypothetical protein ACJIZ3_002347 [Penstemon smallii]|uniref:Epidermal patterning factor-like protein n=1 Tax=Penstemon smallii TaxID=265156 RepID=A0ABD3U664_9LAMI